MDYEEPNYSEEDIDYLLVRFENLKSGKPDSFLDEEGFETLIDYYHETVNLSKAHEVVDFGLLQFPFSTNLLLSKANLLIIDKKYQEALNLLDTVELLSPSDVDVYILRTDAFLALDKQELAAEILEEALHKFDGEERMDLLFELADVYDDYGNFEKVFDCMVMILEIDPNNDEALYKICFWTDFTGRFDDSIKLHKTIIDEFPYNELAWFNLGTAYQGLGLHEKAVDAYQYALAIDDKFDIAYRNLADALIRIRGYKDAIEALEKAIELSRPESTLYEAMAHCHYKLKNYVRARHFLKKAMNISPDDSILIKIAKTYMEEEKWKSAILQMHTGAGNRKRSNEIHIALGICHRELGEFEQSIHELNLVIKRKPKLQQAWIELLHTLYAAELWQDGVAMAEKAYAETGKKATFIYFKAFFLFAAQKNKEAISWLELAITSDPRLAVKFIKMNPAILRLPAVVTLLSDFKVGQRKNKKGNEKH